MWENKGGKIVTSRRWRHLSRHHRCKQTAEQKPPRFYASPSAETT